MSIRTNPPQPTVSVKIIRYTSEAPFSVELRQRGAPSGWECHQTDTDKVTRKRRQLQTHQCFETNDRVHPTNGHVPYSFPQRGSVAFVSASAPSRRHREELVEVANDPVKSSSSSSSCVKICLVRRARYGGRKSRFDDRLHDMTLPRHVTRV